MPVHNVLLFAGLKEMVGAPSIDVDLPAGATVDALRDRVAALHPAVASLVAASVIAVNEEYVDDQHRLADTDTIALIPPVSGGASTVILSAAKNLPPSCIRPAIKRHARPSAYRSNPLRPPRLCGEGIP